jgi:hypothetical protein
MNHKTKNKILFLAWLSDSKNWIGSKRADHLSKQLNCKFFIAKSIIKHRGSLWKFLFWIDYVYKFFNTLSYLLKYRPHICIAQSGPSFCPLTTNIYTKLFKKKLIIDSHNSSFSKPWINVPFYESLLERADAELMKYLSSKFPKVNFYLLPDKLPEYSFQKKSNSEKYILISASHSEDEPLDEILEGIDLYCDKNKSTDIVFKITGNYYRNVNLYNRFKSHKKIFFLGYVPDDQYANELKNAYGLISLSTRKMIQQCAIVESIAAEVPFIVSESETAVRLYDKGGMITKNDKNSISKAIEVFLGNHCRLSHEISDLKERQEKDWFKLYSHFFSEVIMDRNYSLNPYEIEQHHNS